MHLTAFITLLLSLFIAITTALPSGPSGPPPSGTGGGCSSNRVSTTANSYLASFPCVRNAFNNGFSSSTACQACDVNNLARVLGPAIAVCPGAEITTLQGRLADLKATLDAACLA